MLGAPRNKKNQPDPILRKFNVDAFGNPLSTRQKVVQYLAHKVGLDTVTESSDVEISTLRNPTSNGIFGSEMTDSELVFAVQREPSAFRIVVVFSNDVFDNWFSLEQIVEEGTKPDAALEAEFQAEAERLDARTNLTRAELFNRWLGYSVMLYGYEDGGAELSEPISDTADRPARIKSMEPYSKQKITKIVEEQDPTSERDGYPKSIELKIGKNKKVVDASRFGWCSTLLVDHRYKGWSALQPIFDDVGGYRYMRWGAYMTVIRNGGGFPDVTITGANQATIDDFIASGQFDNINQNTYFAHNETQQLEFKGTAGQTINPAPYQEIGVGALSLGTGIPKPTFLGNQAGAITGSEENTKGYFKGISAEQSNVEPFTRDFINRVLAYLRPGKTIKYKINWKSGFEPSPKEKAEVNLAEETAYNTALESVSKGGASLNEVRKRHGREPIKDAWANELGKLSPNAAPALPAFNPFQQQQPREELATQQRKQEPGADEVSSGPKPKPTFTALMQNLGRQVMDGEKTKQDALIEGEALVKEFAALEQQHALIYVRGMAGKRAQPTEVVLPPEFQAQLDRQKAQYKSDLKTMLDNSERLFLAEQAKKA